MCFSKWLFVTYWQPLHYILIAIAKCQTNLLYDSPTKWPTKFCCDSCQHLCWHCDAPFTLISFLFCLVLNVSALFIVVKHWLIVICLWWVPFSVCFWPWWIADGSITCCVCVLPLFWMQTSPDLWVGHLPDLWCLHSVIFVH